VSSTSPIGIHCEIDSLEEPIRGRLSDERGRAVEFSGWMEFSTVLIDLAEDTRNAITVQTKEEGTS